MSMEDWQWPETDAICSAREDVAESLEKLSDLIKDIDTKQCELAYKIAKDMAQDISFYAVPIFDDNNNIKDFEIKLSLYDMFDEDWYDDKKFMAAFKKNTSVSISDIIKINTFDCSFGDISKVLRRIADDIDK